jgi:general stress protein 26
MPGGTLMENELRQSALDFLRANPLTHVATVDGAAPRVRVMHLARADDDFTLWYCTFASSGKVRQLAQNRAVAISACDGEHDLRLSGTAQVLRDAEVRHGLWRAQWLRYFPQGPDDPEYVVLRISVDSVLYER